MGERENENMRIFDKVQRSVIHQGDCICGVSFSVLFTFLQTLDAACGGGVFLVLDLLSTSTGSRFHSHKYRS